jgi:hypothetical protein
MQAEILVRMVNQIAEFYGTGSEPDVAAKETLSHLQRMWAHRMCRQMVDIGADDPGLSPIGRQAVGLLAAAHAEKQSLG